MPIGDKRSEEKWLIQVQRVLGKWEGIHLLKADLEEWQKAAYIQNREM